jgi:serpin B
MNTAIRHIWNYLSVAGLALLLACDKDQPEPGARSEVLPQVTPMQQELVAINNNMAYRLLQALSNEDRQGNIFFSPLSIGMSLGMLYNATSGEAKAEIDQALGNEIFSQNDLNKAYSEILHLLHVVDEKRELAMANALWYSDRLTIAEEYRAKLMAYYDAEVRDMNMASKASVNAVNRWSNMKTEGKIPKITSGLNDQAQWLLMSGIHYRGAWQQPFLSHDGFVSTFYTADEGTEEVRMMHGDNIFVRYAKGAGAEIIELPYHIAQLTLTLIVPESEGTHAFIEHKGSEQFLKMLNDTDTVVADVVLPTFTLDRSMHLKEVLGALGIKSAFAEKADYPGLFQNTRNTPLFSIEHKAGIEVQATALADNATTLVNDGTAVRAGATRILVDKPFIFLLREHHSQAILLCGILNSPGVLPDGNSTASTK